MSFDLHRPTTLAEAIALNVQFGHTARFIAGGTDVVIQINRKKISPAHLIDISLIPGMNGISELANVYSIGSLTTYRTIERCPTFQSELFALVEAAKVVGGHQVRNIATVGGNIVNASPAADFVPPMLTLNAVLDIVGPKGSRSVALSDFITGPGKTNLEVGELITATRFERLPANTATAFLKAGRRKAMEISIVCVAASLTLNKRGTQCVGVRLAVGAVGPKTLRPERAEASLTGQAPSLANFRAAGQLASEAAAPITDVRASADYRYHLVAVLVERALTQCMGRITREYQ